MPTEAVRRTARTRRPVRVPSSSRSPARDEPSREACPSRLIQGQSGEVAGSRPSVADRMVASGGDALCEIDEAFAPEELGQGLARVAAAVQAALAVGQQPDAVTPKAGAEPELDAREGGVEGRNCGNQKGQDCDQTAATVTR